MATSSSLSVSSLTPTSPLQVTGLASGLDTNSIVQQLMAVNARPLTALQNQVSAEQARTTALTSVQTALQGLVASAQALSNATLFQSSQSVSSTNSAVVSASTTGQVGAVVGGYEISVSQLASAAQQTFSFTSPSAADTVTIGHQVTTPNGPQTQSSTYNLAAGASAQDLANAVNADSSGTVWATVVGGQLVFSDRTTGSASSFTVSDSASALAAQGTQTAGLDAQYTVNGGSTQSSHSNTVTSAIPGVTLTLSGVTAPSAPVTVNVSAPAVSTAAVTQAVQSFVSTYNAVLQQVSTQLSTAPSTSDPTQGTLYMDPELRDLLTTMRQALYTGGSGLPAGMASMLDLGVSTGATTGSGAINPNSVSGQLTLNTATLTQAVTANPSGATAVLQSFSQTFAGLVNPVAQVGGSLATRISDNGEDIAQLNLQVSNMQAALADQQNQLTQTFANLESALSQNQSTASWLTSQLAALPIP